jgi:hypothetical protein
MWGRVLIKLLQQWEQRTSDGVERLTSHAYRGTAKNGEAGRDCSASTDVIALGLSWSRLYCARDDWQQLLAIRDVTQNPRPWDHGDTENNIICFQHIKMYVISGSHVDQCDDVSWDVMCLYFI